MLSHNYEKEFFGDIRRALGTKPNFVGMYKTFSQVFNMVLSLNTQFVTIQFSGPYAKTSYLLKENNASYHLTRSINAARVRIKNFNNALDKSSLEAELEQNYLYDFEALCQFIALVYDCEIPEDLLSLMPAPRETEEQVTASEEYEYLRFIVTKWDEQYLYGEIDGFGIDNTVSYTHCFQGNQKCCWSYIVKLIKNGSQLNLVRPHIKDNIIYPELIIFEPDCLVNISDIANGFQPYGTTYLNQLLNKLQPEQHSEALLLGNFAGQLLDEEINTNQQSYKDSVMKFFKHNAFDMLATQVKPNFHAEAQRQKQNIHKAFEELPKAVKEYDRSKVILEPSFFSQILGLQGRVDLMQQDFEFLVEQKSGKSEFPFPQRPEDRPKAKEQHIVQILLYMMIMRYNYRNLYERNKGISSFLLYSKYATSLCGVAFAPELMFEAMMLRNKIVRAEYLYAEKGFSLLDKLTPEHFKTRTVSPSLWDNYTLPKLQEILNPVQNATELERKYFHHMMKFVANEHLLSKIGSNQRDDHGLASVWLNTLEEKLLSGNIYIDLTLVSPTIGHKGVVKEVVLAFEKREDNNMANFRKNDKVILYPYAQNTCPDACKTIIMRGSISEIANDTLIVHLNAPQSDARIFTEANGSMWAIEHDFMESSYSSQYRGIHSFLTAEKKRRDLLLMLREPEIDETKELARDYGSFNQLSLRVKQAQDLFLIIGPPGTGKTSFGMLNTLKEELTNPDSSVIITSYTNRAVDEICSKLVEEGIDFIRIGSSLSAEPKYREYCLSSIVEQCPDLESLRQRILSARIIIGTTTAFSSNTTIFNLKQFDLAIIDEASQILEPHLLPILCAKHNGESAIKKFVMIGDHKQLPAVVKQDQKLSEVTDPDLNAINLKDCRLSLFERLLGRYGDNPQVTYMLTKQGRMHRDIAMFPNLFFYEGKLEVVPREHQAVDLPKKGEGQNGIQDLISTRRIAFLGVDAPDDEHFISDKVNQAEAEVIAATVIEIYKKNIDSFKVDETIGIIVPYRNQIATVRNAIDRYCFPALHDITIDTVERYQGSQRDYILFGFTVQKYYQLDFLTSNSFVENGKTIDRKLNVAMTRAMKHLIMVGNPVLLVNDDIFSALIGFIKERHSFFQIPVEKYVSGDFKVADMP